MTQTPPDPAAPVIVIDLQTGMFNGDIEPPIHGGDVLTSRVRAVLAWARGAGRKVAFVRHDGGAGEALAPGARGWPVWPALGQAEDEPTFGKDVGDAFSNPALGEWVAGLGAGEVVLLGAQSDQCVTATTQGALARGLKVTVVSDAHSTWPWNGESTDQIIARCNAAFKDAGARLATTAALTGA